MKIYKGETPDKVFVINGSRRKKLDLCSNRMRRANWFAWGNSKMIAGGLDQQMRHSNGLMQLAFAILADHFGTTDGRAEKFYQRFKYRTVANYDTHSGWSLSSDEIDAVIGAIMQVENDTRIGRQQIALERPPLLTVTDQSVKITQGRDQGDPSVNAAKR